MVNRIFFKFSNDYEMSLSTDNQQLRAENEALKFSESIQKKRADDLEAKLKTLEAENQRAMQELVDAKKEIATLLPVKEQHDIKCFAASFFSTCFNTLQLSQEILEKIFPDDQTVRATVCGTTIRKMFEFVTHPLLPLNFFDSGDSIDIKLHTDTDQFMEFTFAFAKFIYASNMELPGGDFIVCGMYEPKKVQRVLSNCGQRVYEFVKFVVSFYRRNTQKKYKIVFSCDAGHSFPKEDFDVNSLTLDAIRGFDAWVNGSQIPVLQIIMGIMNRRAQWYSLPDAHFSGFLRVLNLRKTKMYVLHGCPSVSKTKFCPFSQDASKYALEFSGCRCVIDQSVSILMLCGFLKSNPDRPLSCPFCKEILPNLTHELNCDPASVPFDLSCIEHANVLQQAELKGLQEHGRSISRIFGLGVSPLSELDEIMRQLLSFGKVRRPWSRLPDLPELPENVAALFFPVNPDEDSDPEPEPESDEDDQEDLDLPEDQEDQDDQEDQEDPDLYDPEDGNQYCPRIQQVQQQVQDFLIYDSDEYCTSDDESYYEESDNLRVNCDDVELDVQVEQADPDDYQENQGYRPNCSQNQGNESDDGYASD
jgi:hypothetical protein